MIVRRRLAENNLHGRIASRKPNVSKKNIKKRLQFSNNHINKDSNFWKIIVWSDESKFNVFGNDSRPYVRRSVNTQLNPNYTKQKRLSTVGHH